MIIERDLDALRISGVRELNAANAFVLEKMVSAARTSNAKDIELDLSETFALDSSGLGALIALRNAAERPGGVLRLVNPTPLARRILELTRLHRDLEIRGQGCPRSELFLVSRRRRDGEGHFLDSLAPDNVQHADDSPVRGVLVAADINGEIRVDPEPVRQHRLKRHQVELRGSHVDIAQLVHGNIKNIRLEIARGGRGGGQGHLYGPGFDHGQACQHERNEQKEHIVAQMYDF